ncbi:MAG: transcriptional repressor LexA [Gammaproteobacteria bacterium]
MASNNDSQHLERLRRFYAENESLPSYAELGRLLGFGSKSSSFKFVERLIAAGLLARGARGPKPTEHFLVGVESDQLALLPLVGRVAAGSPVMSDANYEDYRRGDPRRFRPRADYLLKVRGASRRDAGILDGDLLAVHSTPTAHHGQVVVARIDDEITVKRFEQRGNIVLLKPENPAHQPIRVDLREQEFAIEGVYAGLLRPGDG